MGIMKTKFKIFKDFLVFLSKRVKNDMIFRVSASLSYTSLLAIVPLFAIVLAIFSAFPIFADFKVQAQEFLLKNFVPEIATDLTTHITIFVEASAKLTAIGIAGLAVTAILMLSTIENSLNFIFKVYKARRITTKITLYWTVITLGPLLLGAAFSLKGYLFTWHNDGWVNKYLPSILTYIVIVLLYVFVPNRKVKLKHALVGALVAVALFAVLRLVFGSFMVSVMAYKTLYGAMAVLPIFLIWMYLVWVMVIFGAVTTAAIQEFIDESHKLSAKKQ